MKNLLTLTFLLLLFSINSQSQILNVPNPPGYSFAQLRFKSYLRIAPNGHLWIGYKTIGAGEYDGTSWRIYSDTSGMPSNNTTAIDFDGSVTWIGTDSGLVKTDGLNILTFNTTNSGMPSNHIKSILVSDTTLWIGTDAGVVSFNGTVFEIFNTSNSPIISDTIIAIGENNFGVYFTDGNDIIAKTSSGWSHVDHSNALLKRFIRSQNGDLYIANYFVQDSVLKEIIIPSDPCYFDDVLNLRPAIVLGATTNSVWLSHKVSWHKSILFDVDNSLSYQNAYHLNDSVINQSLPQYYQPDYIQTFAVNSSGDLYVASDTLIYKVSISQLAPYTGHDSCPYLDINQVRARILNNGSEFWDLEGSSLYEAPRGGNTAPIFSEGLWLGGIDPQGSLHLAAQTYRQSGNDFWTGPLDTINATIDSITKTEYDKLWKIDRYTINVFNEKFADGSVANGSYTIPDIILNWPAHGNGNITRNLAPFVDHNNDGLYNPLDGDYPDIKGDQMLWWVFNDNYSQHEETNSKNLGVEIHGSAYAYTCPLVTGVDSIVNYTTFYHYEFFNRSDTSYHDMLAGIHTDVDLGNYLDDYVGCDTSLNIAFAYNSDNDDEGFSGYGLNPPMFNLALLRGPSATPNDGIDNNHNGVTDEPGENCALNHFMYYNNDFTPIGNPISAEQFYDQMRAIWKDGVPVTYGGNGYDTSSSNYTNFMYSGNPYNPGEWSEFSPCIGCQPFAGSDRRFTVSSGPFDLPAHEMRSLDYAYVYTRDPGNPNGASTSYTVNHDQVMRIKQFFETDSFPCGHWIGIDENKEDIFGLNIFPNPAHSAITITLKNNHSEIDFAITDALGKQISVFNNRLTSFRIATDHFSSGVYFLHAKSKEGYSVKRFIID